MKRSIAILLACAAAVGLQACAALPGGGPPPLDTYELTAPAVSSAPRRRSSTQILVAEPSALKSLDGPNIVVKPAPSSVQYLKGAQWADRLPKVVQARLAEAFQKTGRFAGVGKPGEGLAIDYQVIAEIRAFEIDISGDDRAHVELFVRILNDRNGTVRASKTFSADVAVAGSGNDAFVEALDAAFGSVATEIVGWGSRLM